MDEKLELTPEQREQVNRTVDRILEEKKARRTGSRVFCVRCGGGKRTPLRRWHNSYICNECWKILNVIGEDEFLKELENDH